MTAAKRPTSEAVLKRAAVEVQRRGHWKGEYRGPHGEVCALGAIELAVVELSDAGRGYGQWRTLHAEAMHRFGKFLGSTMHITAWNDTPARTAAEVVAALESAAGMDFEPAPPFQAAVS